MHITTIQKFAGFIYDIRLVLSWNNSGWPMLSYNTAKQSISANWKKISIPEWTITKRSLHCCTMAFDGLLLWSCVIFSYFLSVLFCATSSHTWGQLSNGVDMFWEWNKYHKYATYLNTFHNTSWWQPMEKDTQSLGDNLFMLLHYMDAKLWLDIHINHKGVHVVYKETQGSMFLYCLLAYE